MRASHLPEGWLLTVLHTFQQTAAFEEGLRAYALHQASVHQRLFNTFAQQWHDVPVFIAITDCGLMDEVVPCSMCSVYLCTFYCILIVF